MWHFWWVNRKKCKFKLATIPINKICPYHVHVCRIMTKLIFHFTVLKLCSAPKHQNPSFTGVSEKHSQILNTKTLSRNTCSFFSVLISMYFQYLVLYGKELTVFNLHRQLVIQNTITEMFHLEKGHWLEWILALRTFTSEYQFIGCKAKANKTGLGDYLTNSLCCWLK